MHPVRFNINRLFPFLQENDVAGDFRAGICPESVIRQADCTEQFGPLRDILPDFGGLFIHGALGSDKRHNATRTDLIQRFCEEIVVNQEILLVKAFVRKLIETKGYIANRQIKEITAIRFFKAGDHDISLRIQVLRNSASNAVQFHTVQPAVCHVLRQKAEEVANAA